MKIKSLELINQYIDDPKLTEKENHAAQIITDLYMFGALVIVWYGIGYGISSIVNRRH